MWLSSWEHMIHADFHLLRRIFNVLLMPKRVALEFPTPTG